MKNSVSKMLLVDFRKVKKTLLSNLGPSHMLIALSKFYKVLKLYNFSKTG